MQGQEPSRRAALTLLGLAEGADRAAVIHAFRRLARATHPDVSDAPDAEARFTALAAAYRRALVGAEKPLLEPGAASKVRVTMHIAREDPFLRRAAPTGAVRRPGPVILGPTVIAPPIVVGPVRVVPLSPRTGARGRT